MKLKKYEDHINSSKERNVLVCTPSTFQMQKSRVFTDIFLYRHLEEV